MGKRLLELCEALEQLQFWIRQSDQQAMVKIEEINTLVNQLERAGSFRELVLFGPVVRDAAPVLQGLGGPGLIQTAFCVPGGIGALLWEPRHDAGENQLQKPPVSLLGMRFVGFENCDEKLKGLLLPTVDELLDVFWRLRI